MAGAEIHLQIRYRLQRPAAVTQACARLVKALVTATSGMDAQVRYWHELYDNTVANNSFRDMHGGHTLACVWPTRTLPIKPATFRKVNFK